LYSVIVLFYSFSMDVAEMEIEISGLMERVDTAQKKQIRCKKKALEEDEYASELQQHLITKLYEQLTYMKQELPFTQKQLTQTQEQLMQTQEQLERSFKQQERLQDELMSVQERMMSIEKKAIALKRDNDRLQEALDSKALACHNGAKELTSCEFKLSTMQATNGSLLQQISKLEAELAASTRMLTAFSNSRNEEKSARSQLQVIHNALESQQRENAKLQQKVEKYKKEMEQFRNGKDKTDALNKQLASTYFQKQQLRQHVEEIQSEMLKTSINVDAVSDILKTILESLRDSSANPESPRGSVLNRLRSKS